MSQSQRVLSGSLTKGTRVTEREQLIPFQQGLNVKTGDIFVNRINPALRSGDTLGIFKNGVRMRDTFDDTITINNELTDLREDQDAFEQRYVFDLERTTFGQPPVTPQLEPLVDLVDFNPVTFIQDEGTLMYPSNLWNLGELPKHEFDGVIEPLDIRRSLLGYTDLRFEGRTFRASLTGPFSESPFGSKPITDTWKLSDPHEFPFLDAPMAHTRSVFTAPIMAPAKDWLLSKWNAAGYTYTEEEAASILLLGDLTATPSDLTSAAHPLLYNGSTGVNYNIASNTIGVNTYSAHQGIEVAGTAAYIQFAPRGDDSIETYWDAKIGEGSEDSNRDISFTIAMFVKADDDGSNDTSQFLFELGAANGNVSGDPSFGGNIDIRYDNDGSAGTPRRLQLILHDKRTYTSGRAYIQSNTTDFLSDMQWHHIAVTCTIRNGTGHGSFNGSLPRQGRTLITTEMYVDGVAVGATRGNDLTPEISDTFYSDFSIRKVDASESGDQGVAQFAGARSTGSTFDFDGSIAQPAIWSTALSAEGVSAVYNVSKTVAFNSIVVGRLDPPPEPRAISQKMSFQGFQDIRQVQDNPLIETDYHDVVYKRVSIHNEDDIMNALRLLNSSSCSDLTNPNEKSASRGFYFGDRAGSITFGDTFTVGEYE